MDSCGDLTVISLTVNAYFVAWLVASVGLRIISKWRRSRLKLVKGQGHVWDDFLDTYRSHIAAILTDSIFAVGLLACGLYLLTGGNVIMSPARSHQPAENDVTVAITMFNVALGRLIVAIIMALRRLRVVTSANAASSATMQCVDHLVSLVTLSFIIAHREDYLTGTLLLIMPIDCNLYNLSLLLDKLNSDNQGRVRDIIRVLQCFLSIAFRLAVPVICTIVSFVVFNRNVLAMNTQSLSIFIASTVFYIVYNTHLIVTAAIALWRACASDKKNRNSALTGTLNDAFFLNYNSQRQDFGAKRSAISNHIVCSLNDLDNYLDQHVPPPYRDYKRLPTPRYVRPTLHVPPPPPPPKQCRKCSGYYAGVVVPPSAAALAAAGVTSLPPPPPPTVSARVPPTHLKAQPKLVRSGSKTKSRTSVPFTAELPPIKEEKTDGFSTVSLQD